MKTLRYLVGTFEGNTPLLLGLSTHTKILSFFPGLIPQLIGVAPEKAIKLTVSFLSLNWCHYLRLSCSQQQCWWDCENGYTIFTPMETFGEILLLSWDKYFDNSEIWWCVSRGDGRKFWWTDLVFLIRLMTLSGINLPKEMAPSHCRQKSSLEAV